MTNTAQLELKQYEKAPTDLCAILTYKLNYNRSGFCGFYQIIPVYNEVILLSNTGAFQWVM